jgi:hypothetical protein
LDNLYQKALEFARKNDRCTIVALQRHLKTGLLEVDKERGKEVSNYRKLDRER